jgi:uncharacterized membrane protein YfcA
VTKVLLSSPLGFLIGFSLGALGGGGSVLAVPVLVYVVGQEPAAATTTSLVVVGLAALAGMGDHWRGGRVRLGVGVVFGLAGVGGSVGGSALNRRLDPNVLLLAFAALVLVAAWRMLTGCPSCTKAGEDRAVASGETGSGSVAVIAGLRVDARTVAKVLGAGTLVGFFTGLFGVGGGFIIVPALTLLLGFAMPEAVGTSLLIIAVNAAVALAARLGTATVDWSVTAPFALAALAGVLAGSRAADLLPARTMLRSFAALLIAVGAYTATRSVLSL